jgi:hypothetical protein
MKKEKQLTAVEWLVQQLFNNGYFHEGVPEDIVERADKIFENQIIDARDALFHGTPEQYYNETFKSE